MSVKSCDRKPNDAEYVRKSRNALDLTINNVEKMGKKNKFLSDKIFNLCLTSFENALKADSIYMDANNFRETYEMKQEYTRKALANIMASEGVFDIIYCRVRKGDPCFGDKNKRDNVFKEWGSAIEESRKILNKMIEVNKERRNKWYFEARARKKIKLEENNKAPEEAKKTSEKVDSNSSLSKDTK